MAVINGTIGNDQSLGQSTATSGDDQLFGFSGFDWLFPSLGNDLLDGGADEDLIFYDYSIPGFGPLINGVFVNNTAFSVSGLAPFTVDKRGSGTDTIISIENFHGTNFDDVIYVGGLGNSYTFDRAGNDFIVASQDPNAVDDHLFVAGSGNDTLTGTVLFQVLRLMDGETPIH